VGDDAPRIWRLCVQGIASAPALWGIDYLLAGPVTQRACSPSGKPLGPSYPRFLGNVSAAVKTIRSDLSALVNEPGKFGHPDHGLGGQLLELPPGESSLLCKLSSVIPDNPAPGNVSELLSHGATVTVTVTPRFFLARTA